MEIKPCPFCGSDNIHVQEYISAIGKLFYTVSCANTKCLRKVSTDFFDSKDKAIAIWNVRMDTNIKD